jgi:trehalose 6-phosphate phosphatase
MGSVEPTDRLRDRLAKAAVLTDFDGTLSPIVDDPAAAVAGPGAVEVLGALAERAALVGVVSGRPVDVLARHVPDERIQLSGLYGMERRVAGAVVDAPGAGRWLAPVADAAADLEGVLPAGVVVEAKRFSLTVHFRRVPGAEGEVVVLAEEVAGRHGLTVRPARMSVELHPPATPDKGVVVEDLAAGCEAACFLGDDVGDLPAFAALDRLAERGLAVVKVGVRSDESAPDLVAAADVLVDGPAGAVEWLRSLL